MHVIVKRAEKPWFIPAHPEKERNIYVRAPLAKRKEKRKKKVKLTFTLKLEGLLR